METIKILDATTQEVFIFDDSNDGYWWFEFRNTVFGSCIIPVSHSITGDRINFYEDLGITDVIFSVEEAVDAFENWYNDRNETSFTFCVEEEFEDVLINQGIDHLRHDIQEALESAYNEDNVYNTDIIIERDGRVRTHNYYGSIDYRDSDIVLVYTISTQSKDSFLSMIRENLSDNQKQYCRDNNWLSMFQTNSEDEDDFEEFTMSDFDWDDTIEEIKEKFEYNFSFEESEEYL
jgi:hypothetical protein